MTQVDGLVWINRLAIGLSARRRLVRLPPGDRSGASTSAILVVAALVLVSIFTQWLVLRAEQRGEAASSQGPPAL